MLPKLDSATASCALVSCTSSDCSTTGSLCRWGSYCRNGACNTNATAIGEACASDTECSGPFGGAYCSGVCLRPRILGEACSAPSHCPSPMTCTSGHCASDYSLGLEQPCNTTATSPQQCRLSLMCDAATATCVHLPTLGAACTPEFGCDVPYQCSAAGVCTGLLGAAEGEHCVTSLHCAIGLVCTRSGVCVRPPNATDSDDDDDDVADASEDACDEDSDCSDREYCACATTRGFRRCFALPVARATTADAFERLAGCAALDVDNGVAACADEVLAVLKADNSSSMLFASCAHAAASTHPASTAINGALLIVPVAVLGLVLVLVLAVRFGSGVH